MSKQEITTFHFQSCWVLMRLKNHFQGLKTVKKTKASQGITESQ